MRQRISSHFGANYVNTTLAVAVCRQGSMMEAYGMRHWTTVLAEEAGRASAL